MAQNRRELDDHDVVQAYLAEIGDHRILSAEEEHELGRRARDGDEEARAELVRCNLKLVVSLATEFRAEGLSLLDLIQEGNQGLIRAAEKFDPDRGSRFGTCLRWWVRQAVQRAIQDHGRVIRLPVHVHEKLRRIRNHSRALSQELGREPDREEIAAACDLPAERVEDYLQAAGPPVSLQTPTGREGDGQLADRLAGPDEPGPEREVLRRSVHRELERLMAKLEPRDRTILHHRFGLGRDEPVPLRELGRRLGITRERTRQLEKRALARLRALDERGTLEEWVQGEAEPEQV